MNVQLLHEAKATLGEGPVWDARTQNLYWVDILNKKVFAWDQTIAEVDDFVGCLAPQPNGHLILGKRFSFVDLDPDTGHQAILAAVSEPAANRFNDGKCDPAGRFLAGSMDMNEKNATGRLYRFDGKKVETLISNVTISNGMAWSPDHKTFYYIDTPTREICAYDYDITHGEINNRRVAFTVPESMGWPDGMTSDMQGNVWVALWGGAQISKWNPRTGKLLEQIPIPALQTSSCAFGGKNMNELYITSARVGMSETALSKYPLSGGVFKVETTIEGMPAYEFTARA